jgi:predicted N-formylglutamate amidohydrolase
MIRVDRVAPTERPFDQVILTCEHACNAVPSSYQNLMPSGWLLQTHQGWDIGALQLAQFLSKGLTAPLYAAKWTRLLCDLNRDLGHPEIHGPSLRQLPEAQLEDIVARYYRPYRAQVRDRIRQGLTEQKTVLHLSVHSFTARLRGQTRPIDLGLMYDPRCLGESELANQWVSALAAAEPRLRVRCNQPYHGADPYFQSYLRDQFRSARYLAIQIEINQKLPRRQPQRWLRLQQHLRALID